MSKGCKCINPDKDGIECPVHHIAICLRGKDKECHGRCVPIPEYYKVQSFDFQQWLSNEIDYVVNEHIQSDYTDEMPVNVRKISEADELQGGRITFAINNTDKLYLHYSYEFREDNDPLESQQEFSVSIM